MFQKEFNASDLGETYFIEYTYLLSNSSFLAFRLPASSTYKQIFLQQCFNQFDGYTVAYSMCVSMTTSTK